MLKWSYELSKIKNFNFKGEIFNDENLQILFEQLSVYFIFRNLTGALEDGNYSKRVGMMLVSCYLIGAIFEYYGDKLTKEKMYDIVRMYSAEIEYAEENINSIFNAEF